MQQRKSTAVAAVREHLIEHGHEKMAEPATPRGNARVGRRTPASRAVKLLDGEAKIGRSEIPHPFCVIRTDALWQKRAQSRYAIGNGGRRWLPGVSEVLSAAELHSRAFPESRVARSPRGVGFIACDDHAGLRATWQRCRSHFDAVRHAPDVGIRKRIGKQPGMIRNADDLAGATLTEPVAGQYNIAPKPAGWFDENVPEGLAAFTLPGHHRRLRSANPMERAIW